MVPALAFATAMAAIGVWLTTRRDLGGGLVHDRTGPARASRWLATPIGLAARLQRASVLGWAVGLGALGAVYGSFGQDVQDMVSENPELAAYFEQFSGGASVTDAYFGVILLFDAIIATGFTVSSVLRLRTEEAEARAESLLATDVSRTTWMISNLAVTALGSAIVVGTAGLTCGATWALISSDAGQVWQMVLGQLSFLPAMLAVGGFAVLIYVWTPRASGTAWAALAVCFVVGWLGDLLRLPQRVEDISPFTHTPMLPAADPEMLPLAILAGSALVLTALGWFGLRQRDLQGG